METDTTNLDQVQENFINPNKDDPTKESFANELNKVTSSLEEDVKRIDDITQGAELLSVEEYDELAGKCNLFRYIEDKFTSHGFPTHGDWTGKRALEEELVNYPFSFQRSVTNSILRLRFCELEEKTNLDTRELRYTLLDEGSLEDYTSNLDNIVGYLAQELLKLPEYQENASPKEEESN